jgi:hypothetical protein
MIVALILTVLSAAYLVVVILVAAGLYKDPVLRQSEAYAQEDDAFHIIPSMLLGMGLFSLTGGVLFSASVAPRFPTLILGGLFLAAAYTARMQREKLNRFPHLFLTFPRWYAELRERTTREERRKIAYMWLCLPRSMRLHLNGSDHHFAAWADQVILATVTQTVEDQEATAENRDYIPDLHGRWG